MTDEGETAHDQNLHAQVRQDAARWTALPYVGIQHGAADLSYVLELRDCTCGSTLSRRVQEEAMRFEIYQDNAAFRWRLLASNGQVIANSGEIYARREDVHHAIVALQASVITARIADV